jgi:hypothetical protein
MHYLIPICTALAGRFHGGAFYTVTDKIPPFFRNILTSRLSRNFLYALPYFLFLYSYSPHIAILAFIFAFIGINLGHYQFWFMGVQQPDPRSGAIEFILKPLTKFLRYGSLPYSIIGLMIKGAFIGAGTLNPLVIIASAILWPLAYYIGMRLFPLRNDIAEALSGFFGGLALLLYMV